MEEATAETYVSIAEHTGAFTPAEIEVLREVLNDWYHNAHTTYMLLDEKVDHTIAGFVIFGRSPMTEFSWDIYWLVVNKPSQGRGIGKTLLRKVYEFITHTDRRATIRVETAGKESYAHTRNFYRSAGFTEVGRIPDFYSPGDDLVILHRVV